MVKIMARLKEKYIKEVVPELIKLRGYKNQMQVPKMQKIVVNFGINSSVDKDVVKITGGEQKIEIKEVEKPLLED